MRVWLVIICILFSIHYSPEKTFSKALSGSVQEQNYIEQKKHRVVDKNTGLPVGNAIVSFPSQGAETTTDQNGYFNIQPKSNKTLIMSVKARGYKPFSLTITKEGLNRPLQIAISKQAINEIVIDSTLHHLGDNSFSEHSANAGEFKLGSNGPRFSKSFFFKGTKPGEQTYLKIGSIIGLDTKMAKNLGQNGIMNAYSSPAKVFINNQQVGEIKINGDEQEIAIAPSTFYSNANNNISIETGINVLQKEYNDYDDIEFMNLILEVK